MGEYKIPLSIFYQQTEGFGETSERVQELAEGIAEFCKVYKVDARVEETWRGPTVTSFRLALNRELSTRSMMDMVDDMGLFLGEYNLRMYPVDFKTLVLEVPNKKWNAVLLGGLLSAEEMQGDLQGKLQVPLGVNMRGNVVVADLTRMIHTLVGGMTGAGKSLFLRSILASLIYGYSPKELNLILIDPKRVEFCEYEGLPHLMTGKAITDLRESLSALEWAVAEVDRRYGLYEEQSRKGNYVVNADQYNQAVEEAQRLPKLVIVIDEIADLLLADKNETEGLIQKLTQKARAAGIYLLVATQRVSVDVITPPIRCNMMSRVCFRVPTEVESRLMMEKSGAEKLVGRGDFLISIPGKDMERVQAPYVSTKELEALIQYVKENYPDATANAITFPPIVRKYEEESCDVQTGQAGIDPKYIEVLTHVIETGQVSISMVQRKFSLGYNKSAEIIEWMEEKGYISPFDGARARTVYMTKEEFEREFNNRPGGQKDVEMLKFVVGMEELSLLTLQRRFGLTRVKTERFVQWMEKNGYVTKPIEGGYRKVLLSMEEFIKKFGD